MSQTSILLVEDDENLGGVLQEYLSVKGYKVELCRDGEAGWATFRREQYDLCIIDVMMPKQDGFSLARAIRAQNQHVPIVFLTAKSMQADRIEGFQIGADDYVTKPFSVEELLLRIQAIMRRVKQSGERSYTELPDNFPIGAYTFSYRNQVLHHAQATIQLTSKEAELLRLLCIYANQVMKRETALKTIWGDDSYFNGRSMDVFITKLRKYLRLDPSVEIMNVHGLGYKLVIRALSAQEHKA
ncbi:MAG: response regulator transcription factor [Bacteroidota bacterium]|nr:response regulator transcription factor [Candidatus Kapabacteria bacterium]MDW8219929.1 response regulator transcription factor [Bacteroidota bacterium]